MSDILNSDFKTRKKVFYAITIIFSLLLIFNVREVDEINLTTKGNYPNDVIKLTRKDKLVHNLIYFGSNLKIANRYNNADKIRSYSKPDDPSLVRRFPRCIAIGTAKSGTTALRNYFRNNPSVTVSMVGEPEFFNRDVYNEGLDTYLKMMPYSRRDQIMFEKTPSYWGSVKARERIQRFDPSMKLLLVVKNPVERSISHYVHFIKRQNKGWAFKDVFLKEDGNISPHHTTIQISLYAKHLRGWLNYFPRNQIHIIDGDMFVKNPAVELQKVMTFLNLDNYYTPERLHFNETKGFYCMRNNDGRDFCSGNSKDDVYKELADAENINVTEFRVKLANYFQPLNEEFYKIAGETFNWK